jgi:hypothetical protein
MGELSFLTIIVSLAVCSILVFAVYQYMKVRFTVLEHSQKEQALILQQYIEESSYDIQGLQSIVFRQRGGAGVQQEHQAQMDASEPEEVYEDHNKHIHMDTVMYEAPNKPRSTLIAISSDSENTTSDEDDDGEGDGSSSDSDGSSSDGEESGSSSDGSDGSDGSDDSEIESENVHMIHDIHEVKHIEISITADDHDNELEIESVTIIDEEPALETKTITLDLGTSVDTDEHQLAESSTASTESSAAASSASSSVSFHGLSVIELRALLKEKYKGQHDKITNLQKLKKPELIQLLHE